MNEQAIPVIEIGGAPRERGRQQGEGAREQSLRMLESYHQLIPQLLNISWEGCVREARKFLPYGEEAFPNFVEELRGIAEGVGVSFEEVWTLNCYEGLTESRQQVWGCTCIGVRQEHTTNAHVLIAHNEDWHSLDRENVYLVRARPDHRPAFLGMTYGPLLVNIGMNEDGIGIAINSVYPTDGRVGVPRILCSRAVLNARTMSEAIRACVPKLRAGGYAYLLGEPHGEMYVVETSATAYDTIYAEHGWLAHTNHYLSSKMKALEEPGTYAGTTVRYHRAARLLQAQLGHVTVESLQALLRDHVSAPDSICAHEDPNDPLDERGMTLVSLVMDLTEQAMWAAPGPPCEGEYVLYRL